MPYFYNSEEKAQIKFIRVKFKEIILGNGDPVPTRLDVHTIPRGFPYNPGATAINPANIADYNIATWETRLTRLNGAFRIDAKKIISKICEYQTYRSNRILILSPGNPEDPVNLFCEEFKEWALSLVGTAYNPELLETIDKRMQYAKSIEDSPLFKPGMFATAVPMALMLFLVRTALRETRQDVVLTLAKRTAVDEIRELKRSVRDLFEYGVGFLFRIFNDLDSAPMDCTIAGLRTSAIPAVSAYMLRTNAGLWLQRLIEIPNGQLAIQDALAPPAEMIEHLHERGHTGINRLFQNNRMAIKAYLRLYGFLQMLAVFETRCNTAERLAGEGGNLLIYGVTGNATMKYMNGFIYLNSLIKRAVDSLSSIAENVYSELLRKGDTDNHWIEHYRLATSNLELLQDELKRSADTANGMYAKASAGISKEHLAEIRQEAIRYGCDANEFCEQIQVVANQQSTLVNRDDVINAGSAYSDFLLEEHRDLLSLGFFPMGRNGQVVAAPGRAMGLPL